MKDYTILVPLDFSLLSLHALYHAERIAATTQASITLLHVVKPIVDAVGTSGMMSNALRFEKELQADGLRRLQKIAHVAMRRTPVHIEARVALGKIGSTIMSAAKSIGASIIIMGTHGASGFFEKLLGSNTYNVATLSDLPVMCVHKRPVALSYRNVIFPVREHSQSMKKFPYALELAKTFASRVHIVGQEQANNSKNSVKLRQTCDMIEERFLANGIKAKIAFTSSDQFAETIIRYAQMYVGSVVVILQDHDFNLVDVFGGSFSKKVLHKALSPVLTIPK
jgi:nucleotide-binding universal stress UspA family protein